MIHAMGVVKTIIKYIQENRLFTVLLIVAITFVVLVSAENSREYLRKLVNLQPQRLVAKAVGDITGDGSQKIILKFQSSEGIKIEILDSPQISEKLFEWTFANSRDAYIDLPSGVSNMFLKDANGDDIFDVVIPIASGKAQPLLQVIHYNPDTHSFGILQSL